MSLLARACIAFCLAVALPIGVMAAPADVGGDHAKPSVFAGGIGNALITLVVFGVVVYVLGTRAWPPLLKVLQEREHAIHTALENAARERKEAEQLLARYRQQINDARVEATQIVEEGKRDAEAVRRRILEEAKAEADQMVARAKREVQLAADAAIKEIYDRQSELSVAIAGEILGRTLNPTDHQQLVEESLRRMQAAVPSGAN